MAQKFPVHQNHNHQQHHNKEHWGYIRPLQNYGTLILLETEALDEILKGYPKKDILKSLQRTGYLITDKGRLNKKVKINSQANNYYALKTDLIRGKNAPETE